MVGEEVVGFFGCQSYVALLERSLLICAAWPHISVCWKKQQTLRASPCTAPFNLLTEDHARNWTRGPAKHTLLVFVLTLRFSSLYAVIMLLTAEPLSETKEL